MLINSWKQPLNIVTRSPILDIVGASYVFDIYERKHPNKTEWKRGENFHAYVAVEKKHFPEER